MQQTKEYIKQKDISFLRSSKFHLVMIIVWIILVIPTVLFWRTSILWIAFMSIYAAVVGHMGAYQAARAEEIQMSTEENTEE